MPTDVSHGFSICSRQRRFCRCRQSSWPEAAANALDCPKPLLKVGPRAIIDYNIAKLAKNGITDVTATVNYLAEQLEEHFATPVEGIKVKTVREPMPMGTIGPTAPPSS